MPAPPPLPTTSTPSSSLTPTLFAMASTTYGLVGGFTVGFVTAVASNKMDTPLAVPHILRSVRLLGVAGLVHGFVGAALIAIRGNDEFKNRAIAGCTSGLSLGIYQGRPAVACGLCVGLAILSMAEKNMTMGIKSPEKNMRMMDPVFKSDETIVQQLKQRVEWIKELENKK